MSDGPSPKSTCGVDSSPEAIAEIVKRLHPPDDDSAYIFTLRDFLKDAAALLAQVAERAAAAERQLAEARAALEWYGEKAESLARYMAGNDCSQWKLGAVEAVLTELSLDAGQRKARALLSGETT